jgi:hypothetical protein
MDKKEEVNSEEVEKRGNFILRQELTTLTPDCNVKCSLICNLILMIIFFVFGGSIIGSANSVVEVVTEYTNW